MKPIRVLAFSLLAVFAIGCPYVDEFPPPDPDEKSLGFGWYFGGLDIPLDAGDMGLPWRIMLYPMFFDPPRARLFFSGPGTLYHQINHFDTIPYSATLVPFDPSEEFNDNGAGGVYRPPSNDDVPPEGITVTFACEVLSPLTNKWERSRDFNMRVVRRTKPMKFYIKPTFLGDQATYYGPDNPLTHTAMTAGETLEFVLYTDPYPAEDIQLRHSLLGSDGYSGDLGELTVTP
ncbi:MAG: hypothetical protein LBB40_00275, partial [Holophagales bacterium]|nr:hypothetical protein [Holophagales bacterium]